MEDYKNHWEVVNFSRPMAIERPEDLWFLACSYFKWSDEHPLKVARPITTGKDVGKDVKVSLIRPYSVKAMCLHCGITEEWLKDLREMKDSNSDWYHAASRILYIIYIQNTELATVGEYNAVFISKLLRLDSGEDEARSGIKIELVGDVPKLSESENQILEKMDFEKGVFRINED